MVIVQGLTGDEQNFREKLTIMRYYVKAEPLPYPRTVCVSKNCFEVKKDHEGNNQKVFNKHCHERCYLKGVTVETYPNEALMHCTAMNRETGECRVSAYKVIRISLDLHYSIYARRIQFG